MGVAGVLDGEVVEGELALHPRKEVVGGLEQADPDHVARSPEPGRRVLHGREVRDLAPVRVDARGHEAGLGRRRAACEGALIDVLVHRFGCLAG
jgi:hypothetical protein